MTSIDINKLHKNYLFELKTNDKIEIEKNIRNKFKTEKLAFYHILENLKCKNDITIDNELKGTIKSCLLKFNKDTSTKDTSIKSILKTTKTEYFASPTQKLKGVEFNMSNENNINLSVETLSSYINKQIINCNSNLLLIYLTDKLKLYN